MQLAASESLQQNGAFATPKVVSFITNVRYSDLTPDAIEQVKLAILDTIGVTIAGVATPTGHAVCKTAQELGGRPISTVIGAGFMTDPATAALANGTTGHALDYDDVSWTMIGHPSVIVLPAVLALAEERGLSGKDLLLAYIVGFEIAAKLGAAMNPRHYEKGFHATGTLGALAAAAAAAKILALDTQRTSWTLGIAASSASGIRQNFGTDTKPFHPGNAARAGVLAAKLAANGFTANENILDQQWGFLNVFSSSGEYKIEALTDHLAQPWDIVKPGVLLKMYPSCVSTHTSIDAMLKLCADHNITPEQVESVDVGVVTLSTKMLIHDRPTRGLEGKFSMPYCMARAILDRAVKLSHFTDASVQEPAAQALLRKAAMRIEPAVDKTWRAGTPRPAIVTVKLNNGKSFSQRIDNPSGNAGNVELNKVIEKFRDSADTLGNKEVIDKVERTVLDLENLSDIRELTRILAGRPYSEVGVRFS